MSVEINNLNFSFGQQKPQNLIRTSKTVAPKLKYYSQGLLASTSLNLVPKSSLKSQSFSQSIPQVNYSYELGEFKPFKMNPSPHRRTEEATKVSHPASYTFNTGEGPDNTVDLLGVGVREKKLFGLVGIKVYSLAAYINREVLVKWMKEGPTAESIKKMEVTNTLNHIIDGQLVPNMIRIVLTSDKVNRDNFVKSFNESLQPKMIKEKESLDQFRNQFDSVTFSKGVEFTLWQFKEGELETYYNGSKIGQIKSKTLCSAFLDLYLGEKPVSNPAKDNIKKGIQQIIENAK